MGDVQKAPPKLFEHCCRVFNAMRAEAVAIRVEDRHAYVYQGHTTKLFRMLNMPSPYYTKVLNALQAMLCIKQLSRGGGSAESRWELLDDPDLEVFRAFQDQTKASRSRLSVVEENLDSILDRVATLEKQNLENTGT